MLAGYFVIQVMYNGLPRWAWYLVNTRSPRPYPRFDSASKTALYMALALVDSVCVNLAVYLFVGASPESGPSFATRGLNNVWMLLYIGLPCLRARAQLAYAQPAAWIHVPYRNIKKSNLTQRFVIWFVIASALLMLLVSVVVVAFASGDEESFQAVVRTMFHESPSSRRHLPAHVRVPAHLGAPLHAPHRSARPRPTDLHRAHGIRVEQGRRDTCIAVDERGTKPRYEIAELYESTNKMRRDMVGFIERLYNVTAERQRTATELDVAKQIQMSAVPHDFDSLTERFALDIAGFMRPGARGGRRLLRRVRGGRARRGLRHRRRVGQGRSRGAVHDARAKPAAPVPAGNRRSWHGVHPGKPPAVRAQRRMLFVTAFACVVDTATGEVRFANAGHNPPVLKQNGKLGYLACRPGLVLGAMDVVKYREGRLRVQPRRRLLLYTDGVSEAANAAEELYGVRSLAANARQA